MLEKTVRRALMRGSALALVAGCFAFAGSAHAQTSLSDGGAESVTVTGSRVQRPGFESPTPTMVLSAGDIARSGNSNIADTLNDLPAVMGSGTVESSTAGSNYIGQNVLALRGLGAQRTLTLVDGQRFTPTSYWGVTSINVIPQAEVERVEVVTGGASAQWGSDAISGVVNIILNHDLEGIKGSIQGGTTDYGDYANYRISVAAGHTFAGGKAHVEIAGEAADNNGVGPLSRDWLREGWSTIPNPNSQKTAAQPANLVVPNVRTSAAAPGGVITSGPLKGIQFGPGGVPMPFNYGTDVGSKLMVGGDGVLNDTIAAVASPVSRQAGYARFSYDILPNLQAYVQANLGHSLTNTPLTLSASTYDTITIKNDNAFLPAAIKTAMAANRITSFTLGRWSQDYAMNVIHQDVETLQLSGGLKGSFGNGWTWDAYYGYGGTNNPIKVFNNRNLANYALAIDSVINPATGAAVCRSTLTNPGNGCAPLNPFGPGSVSQSAIDYISGTSLKTYDERRAMAALTVNGTPFSTWAGPVSLAAGVEYRHDGGKVTADPISVASGWGVSSQIPWSGADTVTEGFAEFVVPLAHDEWWANDVTVDLAVRETGYSLTGVITTWKAGVDYAINGDIRLRANRSRDYRAPDLDTLYQAGSSGHGNITDPSTNPPTVYPSVYTPNTGNLALKPETSDTTTVGFVATPGFLPNFELSVDYWDIQMANAIVSVSAQNAVNYCYNFGISCDLITRDASGAITQVEATHDNAQSARRSGIDIEAEYRVPDGQFGWNEGWGDLAFHYTGTWLALDNSSLPGAATVREAGDVGSTASGGLSFSGGPRWRFNLSAIWDRGPFEASVTGRYVGGGDLFGANATAANYNILKASNRFYTDVNFQYRLGDDVPGSPVFFLGVRNLLNLDPPTDGETSLGTVPTVSTLYDAIGRQYLGGIRFSL
ncbi:MAG TPA: TonB-dependent receptor [Rhizomicrobium sp.]|nr:TonB-dependent receptor [Rhizomicrobium sp.]